jgi:MmgE/PrpD N-terminal domain
MSDTLARRLARFATDLRYDHIPARVLDKARACLLHNLGVGLAGHGSGAAFKAKSAVLVNESTDAGGARILVTGERATPGAAAFVNSALMHAKLQEDAYHTGSHPGVMIVPAALAAAETLGSSGRELLEALVAGYEVEAAITSDFIPRSNEQGFRSSPIYGPFGAAVAVGKLLKLNEEQLTHAIGFAATFAAGTFEGGDGTDVMVLQVSQAPRSGLLAAQLAAQGARAADTSLEGTIGFYYSFIGSNEGLEHLADHLGERWEIMEVTLKRYPTSMFNQPPIQMMLDLTRAHDIQPEQIESARIEMNDFETSYPGAKFASAYGRRRGLGATAFVVAAACVNRGFALPADRPAGWSSPIEGIDRLPTHPASLELAERISVVGSPSTAPLSPLVTVRLRSGTTHQAQATGNEFKLDFAEDAGIVRALIPEIPGGSDQVEKLIIECEHVAESSDIHGLIDAVVCSGSR